jgi:hypothetical protein
MAKGKKLGPDEKGRLMQRLHAYIVVESARHILAKSETHKTEVATNPSTTGGDVVESGSNGTRPFSGL